MNLRNLTLLVILILVAIFAGLNWSLITAPAQLNLLFAHASAPLGLVLLSVIALLTVLYFFFIAMVETGALLEIRRYARQVEQARKLADKAEASRFAELKTFLEKDLSALKSGQESLKEHTASVVEQGRGALSLEHDTLKSQLNELGNRVNNHSELLKSELLSRLQELQSALAADVEKAGNGLAAYLGEIEDRLSAAAGKDAAGE